MSISKTKDLLGQLSKLERSVKEFSFNELSADEAKGLQNSFTIFRSSLENHIYTPYQTPKLDPKDQEQETVEKKLDGQNQFIAHVSQEIQTSVNRIIGFANLFKEEKLNTVQQKKVQAIKFASDALLKTINDLLQYSKISSESDHFETVDFKIRGLVNDIMYLSDTLLIDRSIQLSLEIDQQVPEIIKGDPSKLSQVLLNLFGNAIKFTDKGHIKLRVSVAECGLNDCVLTISVSDTGIGIPKKKLKTIFESCTPAENDTFGKNASTGLGLSITKEIIKKQNGEIEIFSEVGIGTTITLRIPYNIGGSINTLENRIKGVNVNRSKNYLAGTEILVFDDNLKDTHLIREQLTKWGCKVYTHVNLERGLGLLATRKIDVILMDFKMSSLNGFEISKAIRAHNNSRINSVPIIAFSADFTEQESEDCKSIGVHDFILKPHALDELLYIIMKHKRKESSPKAYNELLQKKMIQSKETTIIDLTPVLKDCFGELDMLKELIRLFKGNVLEFIGNVKIHLESNDLSAIAFSAHKLKAGFAMLKATGMRELIVALEANSKANKLDEVKKLYHMFLEDYPLLEQNLDKQLALLNEN